jgi:hypothetical protein
MIDDYRHLVQEIAQFTGADLPALVEENAPVLGGETLDQDGGGLYLIGLIGGKDVGKSAMVNAIVGREITARTSHGPGTEIVIAYAHEDQAAALRQLLERQVPGDFRIVTHDIAHLRRQVLLDLPDIDSHYAAHIEVTRRMLRHMLFPIWVQSVEKYADRRPQELLALVAEGNAPQNFIFCLNKADQVMAREGEAAARELQRDFSARIARVLAMNEDPRVWLVSALHPGHYDLPDLQKLLAQQKSEETVDLSRQRAIRRQSMSFSRWIKEQNLPQRLDALDRLETAADEELAARVGVPLVERTIPRLMDDPAYRLALADEVMQQRVGRWPVVNIFHLLLGPLLSILRKRLPIEQQRGLASAEQLVDQHLRELDGSAGASGRSLSALVQSTFAALHQSSPQVTRLYAQRKLWDALPADLAEADLRHRLGATIERQRGIIRSRLGGAGIFGWFLRMLLTFGAILWFPFVQPALEAYLNGGRHMLMLAVSLLGVSYLLKHAGFMAIYFTVLWLIIKWDTQRRVDRWLSHWKSGQSLDPALSLTGQVVEWSAGLLEPIRAARQKLAELAKKADEMEEKDEGERMKDEG